MINPITVGLSYSLHGPLQCQGFIVCNILLTSYHVMGCVRNPIPDLFCFHSDESVSKKKYHYSGNWPRFDVALLSVNSKELVPESKSIFTIIPEIAQNYILHILEFRNNRIVYLQLKVKVIKVYEISSHKYFTYDNYECDIKDALAVGIDIQAKPGWSGGLLTNLEGKPIGLLHGNSSLINGNAVFLLG